LPSFDISGNANAPTVEGCGTGTPVFTTAVANSGDATAAITFSLTTAHDIEPDTLCTITTATGMVTNPGTALAANWGDAGKLKLEYAATGNNLAETPIPSTTAITAAPTPAPISSTETRISHNIILSADQVSCPNRYVNPQKSTCELAYGTSLGLAVTASGGTTYKSGISVTSACVTRRSTAVYFEAIMPQLYTQAAQIAAATLTPTTFAAALQTAAAATNVTLTNMVVATTTQTAFTTTSSADNIVLIAVCVIGSIALVVVGAGFIWIWNRSPDVSQQLQIWN